MKPIMFILTGAALALGFGTEVFSEETTHPLVFSGSGSVFQGGPAAGFDYSGSFGGDIGISFRARANSGTVSAHLNGVLRATFPATVPPNSPAAITLQYIGDANGGSLVSDLGASVNVDARVKFETWLGDVNERVPIISEGFYLNPNKVFTPAISSTATGSDIDTAYSFGPSIDIGVGDLGAYVNVNVQQTIQLTPTALNGTVWYTNQTTGVIRQIPFSITPGQTVNLTATNLATAFWDFAITGITLQNSFRNDVDLVLHPYIDYVIDDWSPGDLSFGLIDQTFSLNFNTLQIPIAFTLESQTPQAALATSVEASSLLNISSPTGIVHGVTAPNPWFAQGSVTHSTATAARSGITPPGQGSYMEATFNGPGVLTYWCKVSSTLNHDFLTMISETADALPPWLSGEVNWQQYTLSFTNVLANERTHKVTWYYTTSFYGASGSDTAFVDQIVFTPAPLTFERALDNDKITSITSPIQGNYTAAWFPQTNVTHDGADAMRSGAIADDKWSALTGEISGPGRLSFWWKISAGVNDALYFYLDGASYLVPFLSGTSVWTQASLDIPAGSHALGWLYDANYINTQPGGAGFVDEVVFTPYPFTYNTNPNGTINITGYTGSGGSVTIPVTIAGLPVTTIGTNAFLNKGAVTSVTIGANVTSIGNTAFQNCNGLTNFTIPASVSSIGSNVFDGCKNLIGITVDSLNPVYKSLDGTLFNRSLTTLILCPGGKTGTYTVADSVTNIGVNAFLKCTSLTNIVLPYGVTGISGSAFVNCSNLVSVMVPQSVTFIGNVAFGTCPKLTGVYFQGDAPSPGNSMFTSSLIATNYYGLGAIGWGATYGGRPTATWNPPPPYLYTTTNSAITLTRYYGSGGAVNIPSTINALPVISIGSSAFINQANVTSVIIPSGVTSIEDSAFRSCTSLASITIPNTVTNIGGSAFRSCTNLTSVTIPSSVTSLGSFAFSSCTRLASVTIPNSVTSIGSSAFQNCTSLTRITIPNSVVSVGDQVFFSCTNLTGIYFEGNAPSLGTNVFLNATNQPPFSANIFYLPGAAGWGAMYGNRPTVLWKPQILTSDASFGLHTNQFGFTITWASGTTVFVEACTNLANPAWTPLTTNILTDGSAFFSDVQTTNSPQKFYRAGSGRARLTRWASSVLGYSSQYSALAWSAAQVLGQPETYPNYGDLPTAWASLSPDASVEFLELGYGAPAPIDSISIYETYAPGAVSKVSVRNPNTSLWEEVWSGTAAPAAAAARIFTVSFPPTSFPVSAIRIDLNSPAVPDWNEIDAVSISGVTP